MSALRCCPEFLPRFARERPGLRLVLRAVDSDARALEDLIRNSRFAGIWPPGVPAFVIEGRILVGFDSAAVTGPKLAALIDQRAPTPTTVDSGWLGVLSLDRLGLPLFTLVLGLLDGFNPCAIWVLLFLLSLLVRLHDRRRMALIAGTFVLVSGAVYYLFMSAWLNLFRIVGFSDALCWGLGALALVIGTINIKDFTRSGAGFTLSIPASAKPGLYARMRAVMQTQSVFPALVGVASLAVVVNGVELLCTAGFPAIYTAVLTQQELNPATHYAYLGLYILGYIADDSLMVASAVIALSRPQWPFSLDRRSGRVNFKSYLPTRFFFYCRFYCRSRASALLYRFVAGIAAPRAGICNGFLAVIIHRCCAIFIGRITWLSHMLHLRR